MQVNYIPFDRINALSDRDIAYQTNTSIFEPFIQHSPSIEGFQKAIDLKSKQNIDRKLLVDVLSDHYKGNASILQNINIEALANDQTFTIVTAHQPSILGGPAYYIYKICSVINLCRQLKAIYPSQDFVPVFVSGSEDHDFDEVKNINIFSKTITWESQEAGPVGRFSLHGIDQVLNAFEDIVGESPNAIFLKEIFKNAYTSSQNYNDFVFHWLNALFGKYGLIVFNMDDERLKRRFIPIIKEEIFNKPSETIVKTTQDHIQTSLGFKAQAFAREVNFFYMSRQSRERIVFENDQYSMANVDNTFTQEQMEELIDTSPQNFSPNVVTRPLYQEYILPNLAYIGGGGELAYWMERKLQFEHFGIAMPILMRRNSLMIINKGLQKIIAKLTLSQDELLMDETELIKHYVTKASGTSLELTNEYQQLKTIFDSLSTKALDIDPTLDGWVKSEASKVTKIVEAIEARFIKTIKAKEETSLSQIKNIKSKLFPNGGLQERSESFWNYYVNANETFIDEIINICDPLNKDFLFVDL